MMNALTAICVGKSWFPLYRVFFLSLLLGSTGAQAQVVTTLSQTYGVPTKIDGSSLPVFFDFSSTFISPDVALLRTTLSFSFSKIPDLNDDPPFYSEIGLVLRELSPTFTLLKQVTLIDTSTFNDGLPGAFFTGTISFDDTASQVVNLNPNQPSSGVFRPVEPLSMFKVYSPFWELVVDDASKQNPLLFRSATLSVSVTAVPEPGSTALTAVFCLGMLISVRQRRLYILSRQR